MVIVLFVTLVTVYRFRWKSF